MIYTSPMRRLAVLACLVQTAACASGPSPAPATPAEPAPATLAPAAAQPAEPAPEERRCESSPREPSDNQNVVIDDADGELGSALARAPADAAGQWAEVLRRLSKDCAGSVIEHALPSARVVLRAPADCRAGGPQNELTFDFVPRGEGSSVRARGNLVAQGRALGVEARLTPGADGRALCAAGRVVAGATNETTAGPRPAEPGAREAAVARQRWLVVPFQLVGGVLGLLPVKR